MTPEFTKKKNSMKCVKAFLQIRNNRREII